MKKLSRRVAKFLKNANYVDVDETVNYHKDTNVDVQTAGYNNNTNLDDIQTVDYNNDTNLSDIQTTDTSKTIAAEEILKKYKIFF